MLLGRQGDVPPIDMVLCIVDAATWNGICIW
jgi:hypothetical protein